ncbi:MAG: hypothetical protein ACRD6W_18815 [Nitrososphaerales archaeon]
MSGGGPELNIPSGRRHRRIPRKTAVMRAALASVLGIGLASGAASAAANANGFLLRPGEQPGFTVKGKPTTESTLKSFLASMDLSVSQQKTYEKRFARAGFILASGELLAASKGRQGFSEVVEFRRRTSAREAAASFLAVTRSAQGTAKVSGFTVPGIPSVRGITARGGTTTATANAYWYTGTCMLGSGLYLPHGAKESNAQIDRAVISGIESQERRMKQDCPT